MKILYVANSRFPSERAHMVQIVAMCNAFAALGNEVTLLVTNRATDINEVPENFYGTRFRFTVERVSIPDIVGHIRGIPSLFRASAFMLQRFLFVWKVRKYVKTHTHDCIYGRDEWVLWLLSKLQRTSVVWESHEAKYSFPVRQLFKMGVHAVVISEGIRDFYLKQAVSADQIMVAHDGIDDTFFQEIETKVSSRARLGLPVGAKIAMYIGGFDAWKGVETFFKASEFNEKVSYVAIGGKADDIHMLQKKYPKVTFLGSRPYAELKDNQQVADVLVIPNTAQNELSSSYTSPLKLFAHLASRIPLVVSEIASLTNVVDENQVFYFRPDDPQALASVVEEALKNEQEAQKRAAAAFQLSQKYTWHNRAQAIMDWLV